MSLNSLGTFWRALDVEGATSRLTRRGDFCSYEQIENGHGGERGHGHAYGHGHGGGHGGGHGHGHAYGGERGAFYEQGRNGGLGDDYCERGGRYERPPRLTAHHCGRWGGACRMLCLLVVAFAIAAMTAAALPPSRIFGGGGPGPGLGLGLGLGFWGGGGGAGGAGGGGGTSAAAAPPVPALLRRFELLKRARAPAQGADPASLGRLFPHWSAGERESASVRDLALAIASITKRLGGGDAAAVPYE
jgi:hypothetical protein